MLKPLTLLNLQMWELQGQASLLPHPPQAPPNLCQGRQKQSGENGGRSDARSGFSRQWFRSSFFFSVCRCVSADGVRALADSSGSTVVLGFFSRIRCCFRGSETPEPAGSSLQPVSPYPVSCAWSWDTRHTQSRSGRHGNPLSTYSTRI